MWKYLFGNVIMANGNSIPTTNTATPPPLTVPIPSKEPIASNYQEATVKSSSSSLPPPPLSSIGVAMYSPTPPYISYTA
jgi:hypothetical protein